jgi:RNA polymerase primary sigma factor
MTKQYYATTEPLTIEEERECLRRYRETSDERAIERLINANTGLVIKIVREMCRDNFDEYIAAGRVGLFLAAQRFDLSLDIRFVNYAHHWIRQQIRLQLQDQLIRTPAQVQADFARATNTNDSLTDPPPPDHYNENKKQAWLIHSKRHCAVRLREKTKNSPDVDIADPNALNALDLAIAMDQDDLLKHIHTELPERNADIVARYYGFVTDDDDDGKTTMEKIGRLHGISRERCRQIINVSLKKLRLSLRAAGMVNAA